MYITFAVFVLNANEEKQKKPDAVVSLKKIFDYLAGKKNRLVSKNGKLVINKVVVASNNKGAQPKSTKGYKDYLVAYINQNAKTHRLKVAENSAKYVVMNINATYNIDGVLCNMDIRVPPSGTIKVSIGLTEQKVVKVNSRGDAALKQLKDEIAVEIFDILKFIDKVRPTKLVSLNTEGYNLFSTNLEGRPRKGINNIVNIVSKIASKIPTHEFEDEEREGKKLNKLYIKPTEEHKGILPTVGISRAANLGTQGGVSIKNIIDIRNVVQAEFDKVKNHINYTEKNVLIKTIKKTATCPKGNPEPNNNGICHNNMVPLPNPKTKGLCCYKKILSKAIAKGIVKKYNEYKMNLPQDLRNRITKYNVLPKTKNSASIPRSVSVKSPPSPSKNSLPKYNKAQKKWTFEGKKYNCMTLPKHQIQQLAQTMKLNPEGKKKYLCANIYKELLKRMFNKQTVVRKRFKLLSAKQLNKHT
jgi:hypothetical protein